MKRRHFLSLTGIVSGSCLIPPSIAKRIREIGAGISNTATLGPDNPEEILYALSHYDPSVFTFHLGNPYAEPYCPTLAEFIQDRGYDPNDDSSLIKYLTDERCDDLSDDPEELQEELDQVRLELDSDIERYERDFWLEWDYTTDYCSKARAYHYLNELPLCGNNVDGDDDYELGMVSFIEGDRPGSNLTYCEADSLEAVAALQHRLNQLGTGVRIVTGKEDWSTHTLPVYTPIEAKA